MDDCLGDRKKSVALKGLLEYFLQCRYSPQIACVSLKYCLFVFSWHCVLISLLGYLYDPTAIVVLLRAKCVDMQSFMGNIVTASFAGHVAFLKSHETLDAIVLEV